MHLPTSHDVIHATLSALSGYVFVAFIMFIIYGTDVVQHFSNDGCEMAFMDKHKVNRNTIQAIFFAAAGAFAIAVRVYGLQRNDKLTDVINGKVVFFFISLMLSVCAGVMTLYGVYSGSCNNQDTNAAVASAINGKIDAMGIFAGVTWSLLMTFALLDLDVVAWRTATGKTAVVLYTHVFTLTGWVIRLVFVACVLSVMSEENETKFFENYGNDKVATAACAAVNKDIPDWYKGIWFGTEGVHSNGQLYIKRNDWMWALLWSVIAALVLEFLLRLEEGVVVMGERKNWNTIPAWFKNGRPYYMTLARILQFFSNTVIALEVFVLITSTEYAACPLFNQSNKLIETIYWTSILHTFMGFVSLIWKEYNFHEDANPKFIQRAGNVYEKKSYTRVGNSYE